MDLRTSKRHRDNRPSEEAVNNETVRKLFQAQREHLDIGADVPAAAAGAEGEDEDMYGGGDGDGDVGFDGDTMVDDEMVVAAAVILGKVEANQRSIHDFFGGKRPQQESQAAHVEDHRGLEAGQHDDGMEIDEPSIPSLGRDEGMKGRSLADLLRWDHNDEGQMQEWQCARPVRLPVDFKFAHGFRQTVDQL